MSIIIRSYWPGLKLTSAACESLKTSTAKPWCSSPLLKTVVTSGSSSTMTIRFIDRIKFSPDYFNSVFIFQLGAIFLNHLVIL